jgi:hypothetical protein
MEKKNSGSLTSQTGSIISRFTETSSAHKKDKMKSDKEQQGKIQMKSEVRENGRANAAWLEKHNTSSSRPSSWSHALISVK